MVSPGATKLEFRRATHSDAERVVALVESAYRGEASRAGWTTEADLLDGQRTDRREVDELIADPAVAIVLGTSGGELVGTVAVRIDAERVAHIGMFAIRPTSQGSGLGSALLARGEQVARERGALAAEMTVLEQRLELLAWYGRRGYQPTGATAPFPYGNPRFGLPKRDDLRFVVLGKRLGASGV